MLRGFERRLTPVMRQHHVAGEKAFVDYSGKRIGIADPTTGEIREAEIFVGVLGAHQRRTMGRTHGTDSDHTPSSHRRYAEWTPDRFRRWAGKIGPNTEGLISAVLASRPHPEQGFRTCLGILRSYRGLDPVRLEAVSARAVELGVLNCKGVASLLARKFDPSAADSSPVTLIDHANVRGPRYYN